MGSTPWFLRSRKVARIAAIALVVDLGLGAFSAAMAVSASNAAPSGAAAATSSAVKLKWTADRQIFDPGYVDDSQLDPSDPNQPQFKDLEVTVSQTQDLTDQGLQVSWTGGKATPAAGAASNFLQIMQCWAGPGAAGPAPEQCQWGTPASSVASRTGAAAAGRDLLSGGEADPKQDLGRSYSHAPFGLGEQKLVPFWSIGDPSKKNLGWTNDQDLQPPFDAAQSNEVTYARTAVDGTGQSIVNLQSSLSAPYLGCGNASFIDQGYSCWLVVVPRGEYNLNGAKAADHDDSLPPNSTYVAGSPLSASAWQNRMQVKLGFSPIGANCKLGANEVPTAGSELVAAAFGSWQAALCSQGSTFGYSQVGDGQARSAVQSGGSGSPALAFMTAPIDPAIVGDQTIEYAPVANTAIVLSYLIDKNYNTSLSTNPDLGANGTLVTNLRLTPLLMAKLLTQSYLNDIPGNGEKSAVRQQNPASLTQDPEFLALNPDFQYFYRNAAPDGLMVPFGDTDAAKAVWAWLRSDTDARNFLGGSPDDWGTTINPAYLDLDLDGDTTLASFPKSDPSTYQTGDAPLPGYGTLDLRPYTSNLTDGARRTVNATAGSKVFWDTTKVPAQYAGGSPQTPGGRFELAITTAQAASLYGVPVASLVRGSTATGPGIAPTPESIAAQLTKRVATDVSGVFKVDPMKSVSGGYPLAIPAYAAINVCAASTSELSSYARFLDYVAAGGQVSGTKLGQLPLGYAPLSDADKAQAKAVAADLRAEVKKPKCSSHTGAASPPNGTTSGPATATTTTPSSSTPDGVTVVVPPATGLTAPPASVQPAAVETAALTPAAFVSPAARYAVLAALLFALPCFVAGPSVINAARRRR